MAKKENRISPAELTVLKVLWKKSPLSSSQIVEKLANAEAWHSRTIKTLITRLLKKKIVGHEQEGNRYFYFPLLAERDYQHSISHGFIQRVFGGRISPLVAHYVDNEKISKEEIKELKAILERLDKHA